jgi:hypothetical protein
MTDGLDAHLVDDQAPIVGATLDIGDRQTLGVVHS